MTGLRIRLMECNYDNGVKRIDNPSWETIEEAIRTLNHRSGRIDLWEQRENGAVVMIAGSPGTYALDVMKDDSTAAMLVSKGAENPDVVEFLERSIERIKQLTTSKFLCRL